MVMAIDCLAGHIHGCWERNEESPPASRLSDIDSYAIAKDIYDDETFLNAKAYVSTSNCPLTVK